jgi:hypothetical protein
MSLILVRLPKLRVCTKIVTCDLIAEHAVNRDRGIPAGGPGAGLSGLGAGAGPGAGTAAGGGLAALVNSPHMQQLREVSNPLIVWRDQR